MLNPDGTLYLKNLRGARVADTYICRGDGEETWEPTFTFHGFRYVEVTGLDQKPSLDLIRGVVIQSDTPKAGTWECSDPLLNQLYSNIVWGQRGNYLSVPTDCPQRDERLGWMGDAQVFVRTASYNADVDTFFNQWLLDVAEAQSAKGAYADVSPRVAVGEGVAGWADAGVICPWTLYLVYGDKDILARQHDSMAKYIDYLKTNSKDLIRPAKGYGDWLSVSADTPKDLLATAYFAYSTRLMSKTAAVLGKSDDSARYEQLFQDIRKAFNARFVEPDGKIKGDTQTDYLLALKFDLLDDAQKPDAVRRLVENITSRGTHLSTGFIGVSYLLPVLTEYGHADLAYDLLNQKTYPSWLFSVVHGATTIWERWDGWTPDKGFQNPGMNSFNHYSLGSCGEWMFESAAGIDLDPEKPGFKHIIIHPHYGGGLKWVKATYNSLYGPIKVSWTHEGDDVTLNVCIPPNTTAKVYLPPVWTPIDEMPKNYIGDQTELIRQPVELGSGEYTFTGNEP
jgi:alpha-L-rhamnosidase